MSTATLPRIKCGKCKGYHPSTRQVQFCYQRVRFAKRCMTAGKHNSHPHPGGYCDGGVEPSVQPPVTPRSIMSTKIPMPLLEAMPDGYYASRPDTVAAYTFFRVSRPKRGRFKGTTKIQTQHGPYYEAALVIWPDGTTTVFKRAVENDLLLAAVDPNGCAIAYAEKLGRCMRCNCELTDEQSRYYGIGPECVKHWPHIIDLVAERKGGHYVPGKDD